MIDKFWKYLTYGNVYCGIEHQCEEQNERIHILQVKKDKGKISLQKESSVSSIAELNQYIKEGQHVFLVINDHKVLTKKIEGCNDLDKAVHIAFPNIKLEEFYYEAYITEQNCFVSICRKDHVDALLKAYIDLKIHILDFSLANAISSQIIAHLETSEIQTSNARLCISENHLTNIEILEQADKSAYSLDELSLQNTSINSFSGILSLISDKQTTQKNFSSIISVLKDRFINQQILKIGIKLGLGLIFIILLVNFLVYSNLKDQEQIISSELQINQQYKTTLIELTEKVQKKQKLSQQINEAESTRVALFLDQIAQSIPSNCQLTQIQYQPLGKTVKADKKISIRDQTIHIKGKSAKGIEFSNWLNKIEKLNWVEGVTVSDYGRSAQAMDEFEIKISIKS